MLTICLEWGRSLVAWILRGLDTAWEGMVCVKGPYERLKYDLRRVWACPVCQHRERTGGEFTSWLCPCQASVEPAQRRYMTLVEDGCRRLIPREPMEFGEEWYAAVDVVELPMMDENESADRIASLLVDDEENSDEAAVDEAAVDEAATDEIMETEFESDEPDTADAGPDARLNSLIDPNAPAESSIVVTSADPASVAETSNVALSSGDAGSGDASSGAQTASDGTGPQPAALRGTEARRGRGRKSRRRRRGS